MSSRVTLVEERRTVCSRDCPDVCSVLVGVEAGRAISLRGDRSHPVTRGALCYRTSRFLDTQYSPERLLAPLLRTARGFVPISWDDALDLSVERIEAVLRESGPAALLYYRSGGSLGLLKRVVDSFFDQLGPCARVGGDICTGAGQAAQIADFGVCDGHDLADLANARQIVLWGKDLATTSPHTARVLSDARAKGAEVTLVDPVHTATARLVDCYVQPRPGGDFALAMAVALVLSERELSSPWLARCANLAAYRALLASRPLASWCDQAGVSSDVARELARRVSVRPCAILIGWALARRAHGAASVRAIDALSVLTGNLGASGGGVSYYRRRERLFEASELARKAGSAPRTLLEPLLGAQILAQRAPAIRLVWIAGANPVAMLPDSRATQRALGSREFVVVVDSRMTDTAECADLILPTTTWLEEDDLLGSYGHHFVSASRPALVRPEGVRSDLEIVQALAARMGFGAALAGTPRSWKERLLGERLRAAGWSVEALERGALRHPDAPAVPFADGRVATPDGKVRPLEEAPPDLVRDPEYPLSLLALAARDSQGSQRSGPMPLPPVVRVHPDSAPGIASGQLATLESRIGRMRVRVVHDALQHRELVLGAKGGALRDGACFNALIRARLTDLGAGAVLYDEGVRLRPTRSDVNANALQ